ncbi:MAG TPA: hypothetical protein VFR44_08720 [Actinomycetota bacterium]|nr:hypothetical protein [Actinomycetota bacterium]
MICVGVLLAACGREAVPGAALPLQIERFRSASLTELDAEDVAAEAVDRTGLADVLDAAGFESAIRRSYSGIGPGIRRVEVLLLRFDSGSGAARYLEWQRSHVSDIIGNASVAPQHELVGIPVYVHLPDGCCPKEQVVALAAWRDGPYVARALVAGADADGPQTLELLAALRRGISTDA